MKHPPRLIPRSLVIPLLFFLHRFLEIDAYACHVPPPDPDIAQLHISLVITNLTVITPTPLSPQSTCIAPLSACVVAASLRLNGLYFNVSRAVVVMMVVVKIGHDDEDDNKVASSVRAGGCLTYVSDCLQDAPLMLHSISWTVAASQDSDISSTTSIHTTTFADDGAYVAHHGATGRVCRSSSLDEGTSGTCQSEAADDEKTRVDYTVKVILCFAPNVSATSLSLAAPQLDPVTLCLPRPSTAHLLPAAAAAASYNCAAPSSPPATAALVQTCAVTVNLSSSYPPIMIPDRDAAAAAASAATAASIRVSASFLPCQFRL